MTTLTARRRTDGQTRLTTVDAVPRRGISVFVSLKKPFPFCFVFFRSFAQSENVPALLPRVRWREDLYGGAISQDALPAVLRGRSPTPSF